MNLDYIGLLGFAAGAVSVISFAPQAVRVWRKRSARDLSRWSYFLLCIGSTMWASYGMLIENWQIIIPNVAILLILMTIVVAMIRFK